MMIVEQVPQCRVANTVFRAEDCLHAAPTSVRAAAPCVLRNVMVAQA